MGKRNETAVARQQAFAPGTMLVFDIGYCDFAWFHRLTSQGVFFVTRLKGNSVVRILERRPGPAHSHVLRDELVEMTGRQTVTKYPEPLRRIAVEIT